MNPSTDAADRSILKCICDLVDLFVSTISIRFVWPGSSKPKKPFVGSVTRSSVRFTCGAEVTGVSLEQEQRTISEKINDFFIKMFKEEYLNQFCRGWSWWKIW